MDRKKCVICINQQLEYLCDFRKGLKLGKCALCSSVQLINLIDPEILYKNYIQPLQSSLFWINHNIAFCKFITNIIQFEQPIMEIGASTFVIGKDLIKTYKDYTVFDYSFDKNTIFYPNVKYIEGNCENYEFENNTTIIMSHVFEHLYEPTTFLHNCMKNKVKQIVIAIPNMNNNNKVHITEQHTFSYSDNDIEYLFSLNKYILKNKQFYLDDILFYVFELNEPLTPINRIIEKHRHMHTFSYLSTKINILNHCFIATSGLHSKVLYNKIQNTENIIGVLDNDENVIGIPYVNNNLFIIQSFNILQNYNEQYTVIIPNDLLESIKSELISQIKNINHKLKILIA